MSKSTQSILMLFLLGIGLGGYAIYQITSGPDPDHVWLGLFYLAASIVAFVALLRLPAKRPDDRS
jgi:divalent metal cation (Fe/Co/Zn/Cd) transporter